MVKKELTNDMAFLHYQKTMRRKVYRGLSSHLELHYGHRFAKEQAATARSFFVSRRVLGAWKHAFAAHITMRHHRDQLTIRREHLLMKEVF